MFANKKNNLQKYLQALKDEKEGMLDVNGSVSFMTNFRDLLLFWQDHYLHKDKDCSALEKVDNCSCFHRFSVFILIYILVMTERQWPCDE